MRFFCRDLKPENILLDSQVGGLSTKIHFLSTLIVARQNE